MLCVSVCAYFSETVYGGEEETHSNTKGGQPLAELGFFFMLALCCQVYGFVCFLVKYCFSLNLLTQAVGRNDSSHAIISASGHCWCQRRQSVEQTCDSGSQSGGRIRPYCCPLLGPSAAHPTPQAVVAGVKGYRNRKAQSGELQDRH